MWEQGKGELWGGSELVVPKNTHTHKHLLKGLTRIRARNKAKGGPPHPYSDLLAPHCASLELEKAAPTVPLYLSERQRQREAPRILRDKRGQDCRVPGGFAFLKFGFMAYWGPTLTEMYFFRMWASA